MATFIYARGKRRVELTYSYICVYIYIPRVIRKKLQIILFYNSRDWANEISFPRVIEKFFLKYHNAFNKHLDSANCREKCYYLTIDVSVANSREGHYRAYITYIRAHPANFFSTMASLVLNASPRAGAATDKN